MNASNEKVQVNILLTRDQKERLERVAASEQRTVSNLVRLIVTRELDKRKEPARQAA